MTTIETTIGGQKVRLVAVMQGEDEEEIIKGLGVSDLTAMDGMNELFISQFGDAQNWDEVQDEYPHWAAPIEATGIDTDKITEIIELSRTAYDRTL